MKNFCLFLALLLSFSSMAQSGKLTRNSIGSVAVTSTVTGTGPWSFSGPFTVAGASGNTIDSVRLGDWLLVNYATPGVSGDAWGALTITSKSVAGSTLTLTVANLSNSPLTAPLQLYAYKIVRPTALGLAALDVRSVGTNASAQLLMSNAYRIDSLLGASGGGTDTNIGNTDLSLPDDETRVLTFGYNGSDTYLSYKYDTGIKEALFAPGYQLNKQATDSYTTIVGGQLTAKSPLYESVYFGNKIRYTNTSGRYTELKATPYGSRNKVLIWPVDTMMVGKVLGIASIDTVTDFGAQIAQLSWTTPPAGATGPAGPTGPTGPTGATGATGQGVPTGGTAGQVLAKINSTDYNTTWVSPIAFKAELTSDFTTTTANTFYTPTGFSFTPDTSADYRIEIYGTRLVTSGVAASQNIRLFMSGAAQFANHEILTASPAAAATLCAYSYNTGGGATVATASSTSAANLTERPFIAEGHFQTGSTVGAVSFQINSVTAASTMTLRTGAVMIVTKL
jgi:hypothetical protein